MSAVTFRLPRQIELSIQDQAAGQAGHNQLDSADRISINGRTFDPAHSQDRFGQSVWRYFREVLQLQADQGISDLRGALRLFDLRQQAFAAADQGRCETSDELLRESNTLARGMGLSLMAYADLPGVVGSYFFTMPDGTIAHGGFSTTATACASRRRGGVYIEQHRVPDLGRRLKLPR